MGAQTCPSTLVSTVHFDHKKSVNPSKENLGWLSGPNHIRSTLRTTVQGGETPYHACDIHRGCCARGNNEMFKTQKQNHASSVQEIKDSTVNSAQKLFLKDISDQKIT